MIAISYDYYDYDYAQFLVQGFGSGSCGLLRHASKRPLSHVLFLSTCIFPSPSVGLQDSRFKAPNRKSVISVHMMQPARVWFLPLLVAGNLRLLGAEVV